MEIELASSISIFFNFSNNMFNISNRNISNLLLKYYVIIMKVL